MSEVLHIRVLVVDDSALMRQMLTQILSSDPHIEVVGTAPDPYIAREKIKSLNPDVLTLDIEMPNMDGLTFLKNVMRLRPMPVVMVSSLTERGASATLEALAYGAVDFVTKPKTDLAGQLEEFHDEIIEKVKAAAVAQLKAVQGRTTIEYAGSMSLNSHAEDYVIAIGASTGGTEAIHNVLVALPLSTPPVLITQHIPALFSGSFARRVDRSAVITVMEAEDGCALLGGHAYIAPGDAHLMMQRTKAGYCCRLFDGPKVNRHRPSVDVMFDSVTQAGAARAVGVLLTGMGKDGAGGLGRMKDAGAYTLVQDEASSVVWGMPGAAVALGAACEIAPLGRVAQRIMAAIGAKQSALKKYET